MATTKTKVAKKPAKTPAAENGVPAAEPGEVLTLAEAAAYLRVPEAAVVDSVTVGGLPGRQIGGKWRFLKSSLRDWLNTSRQAGNEAFLALAGSWKDDPCIDEMLEEIYKQRGRPMLEEQE